MEAAAAKLVSLLLVTTASIVTMRMKAADCQEIVGGGRGSWCVARSDASSQALQTALDYACGAGADCIPIQQDGLCFLPNTIQAHASYAFNSYYQRKARAPGSCDFAGTSTVAQTDPSYGSCVYPSSASTAGGNSPTTTPTMSNPNVPTPTTTTTMTPIYGGGSGGGTNGVGGLNPVMNPPFPDNSRAPSEAMSNAFLVSFSSVLILCLTF